MARKTASAKKRKGFADPAVAAVFATYPDNIKTKLMFLRQLIFDVAAQTQGVGELEETLKWGQPSYLTTQSKSGSLIRVDQIKSGAAAYAMYFHCQTTLVDTFKEMYLGKFTFEGNRSIVFRHDEKVAVAELRHCISMVLTYYRDKQLMQGSRIKPRATTRAQRSRR